MKSKTWLHGLIWLLVLAATAAGLFYRTGGSRQEYVTVRGERAILQGSGLYQYDPAPLAEEAIIWDAINFFIGLPFLAVAIVLAGRRSLRGQLLLGGLLFYFFYVYLMYATMMAFNRLFLVYVSIFALSLVAFVLNLQDLDIPDLHLHISAGFPRRLFAIYAFAVGAALILLWGRLIVSIMIPNRFPDNLAGLSTLEAQALDLGLVVPLALATGILLWQRSPWGYLLAGISLTHGVMMFITIPTWIAVPLIQTGQINWIEAAPFLLLCLVGFALAWLFFRNVQEEKKA